MMPVIWSERGVIGFLLLGPREGGGLYTQEEIEIARSTGERLLDTAAGIALSQRLMRLQREQMAATQVLDQRTRRVLHDEVLPLIQTAMISLDQGESTESTIAQLSSAHQEVSNLLRELPVAITSDIERLGFTDALRKMVDAEFARAFDRLEWRLEDGINTEAKRLSPLAAETLYYAAREMIRNAAKHARPIVKAS